jgi:hypothetical protein
MPAMCRRVLVLVALLLVPWQAQAARRPAQSILQSQVARRGRVLSVDDRRGTVWAPDGARRSFAVRRDERFLGFAELDRGWIATGIRARRDSLDLSLVADLGRGIRRLQPPPDRAGSLRTGPTALVDQGRLAGLAWLEGDDLRRFAVRVASLDDATFSSVETVSPPQSGSQSGLTGTVLADGTWLLVWARYDGHDDELYFSQRHPGGDWTAPRRVSANDSVPDVTPQLLARGDGALLAWSQLRGQYEVMTARFDGASWSTPSSLGVPGTLTPSFRRQTEADYLLVRNAWPGGWTAFRLDAGGRPGEFASVVEESRDRPVLRDVPGQGLAFEWAGRSAPEVLRWEPAP